MYSLLCYVMLKIQVTLVCPMMHQWLAPDQIHSWAFGLMSSRASRGWGKELSGVSFDSWGVTVEEEARVKHQHGSKNMFLVIFVKSFPTLQWKFPVHLCRPVPKNGKEVWTGWNQPLLSRKGGLFVIHRWGLDLGWHCGVRSFLHASPPDK